MSQSISNSNVDEVDKMDESFSSYCSSIVSQDDSYSKYIIEFEKNKILTLEDDGLDDLDDETILEKFPSFCDESELQNNFETVDIQIADLIMEENFKEENKDEKILNII